MSLFYVNKATILGNVSQGAVLKTTQNGNYVINFSVATNHSIKKGEQWEDIPTFHNVVFWGKLAQTLAPRLVKGVKVYVEGRIEHRKYEDKNGVTKYISEIVAEKVIDFSRGEGDKQVREPEPKLDIAKEDEINLDEILF